MHVEVARGVVGISMFLGEDGGDVRALAAPRRPPLPKLIIGRQGEATCPKILRKPRIPHSQNGVAGERGPPESTCGGLPESLGRVGARRRGEGSLVLRFVLRAGSSIVAAPAVGLPREGFPFPTRDAAGPTAGLSGRGPPGSVASAAPRRASWGHAAAAARSERASPLSNASSTDLGSQASIPPARCRSPAKRLLFGA